MNNKIIGITLMVLGLFFLNPLSNITGYVVGGEFERTGDLVLGLIFFLTGIFFFTRIGDMERLMSYNLPQHDKERIKSAFRGWDGRITKQQRKILKNLDLSVEEGGKHYKVVANSNPDYFITLSRSPSDFRSGRNASSEIMKLATYTKEGKLK